MPLPLWMYLSPEQQAQLLALQAGAAPSAAPPQAGPTREAAALAQATGATPASVMAGGTPTAAAPSSSTWNSPWGALPVPSASGTNTAVLNALFKDSKPLDPKALDAELSDAERAEVRRSGWAGVAEGATKGDYTTTPLQALAQMFGGYASGAREGRADVRQQRKEGLALNDKDLETRIKLAELFKTDPKGTFGSAETGYYTLGADGKPVQLVPGVGAKPQTVSGAYGAYERQPDGTWRRIAEGRPNEGPETWRPATADEIRTAGLPPGTPAMVSSRGDVRKLDDAPAKDSGATENERRTALMTRVARQVASNGWGSVAPEDRDAYERAYREESAPRIETDPISGRTVRRTSDMSDLPLPPTMIPQGTSGVPKGPTAASEFIEEGASREQLGRFNDAVRAHGNMTTATNRLRQLLQENGGQPALYGDVATKMRLASQEIVTTLGALGDAGVLQPSDIDRFTRMFGDPTSLWEWGKSQAGIGTLDAALEELDGMVQRRLALRAREARVPEFASDAEADAGIRKLPPGASFIGPDGRLHIKE